MCARPRHPFTAHPSDRAHAPGRGYQLTGSTSALGAVFLVFGRPVGEELGLEVAQLLPFTIDTVSILFPVSTSAGETRIIPGSTFEMLIYVDETASGNPDVGEWHPHVLRLAPGVSAQHVRVAKNTRR